MTVASPVRLGRLQAALVELVASFLPAGSTVLWGRQARVRDATTSNLVTIRSRSGPTALAVHGRVGYNAPADVTLSVTGVAAGRYYAEVNGLEAWTDHLPGDTATIVRDRFRTALDLIAADAWFATSDVGADAVRLTPTIPGSLFAMALAGQLSASVGAVSPYRLSSGVRSIALELQAAVRRTSTQPQSDRNGAQDLIVRVLEGFALQSTLERLDRDGFSVIDLSQAPVDLTEISGAETESRCAVDVTALLRSFAWEARDVIERVGATVQGREPDNIFTIAEIVAP